MSLLDRFAIVKTSILSNRKYWFDRMPHDDDPTNFPLIYGALASDSMDHDDDQTMIDIFGVACEELGYSVNNRFQGLTATDEELNKVLDLVESKLK